MQPSSNNHSNCSIWNGSGLSQCQEEIMTVVPLSHTFQEHVRQKETGLQPQLSLTVQVWTLQG